MGPWPLAMGPLATGPLAMPVLVTKAALVTLPNFLLMGFGLVVPDEASYPKPETWEMQWGYGPTCRWTVFPAPSRARPPGHSSAG